MRNKPTNQLEQYAQAIRKHTKRIIVMLPYAQQPRDLTLLLKDGRIIDVGFVITERK